MGTFYKRLVRLIGSRTFFIIILTLFMLGAVWLAFSTRYPMAFDEEYHIGLIRLHALDWNPIFKEQPGGVAQFGALTTDPSYLFHYLMSFPYRLLTVLRFNEQSIIIVLRLINVALFTSSIILIRRVMRKANASQALINASLLFFTLLPVVPFLAATINYDNLQNLLLGAGLLAVLRFRERLQKKRYDLTSFVTFMSIGLLASLVKFTFLPFLTAFAAYWLYATLRFFMKHRQTFTKSIRKEWTVMGKTKRIVITLVFLFSCGLFLNSYARNIIRYHNPVPQCGQVVGVERCKAYSPWYRNYLYARNNPPVDPNPILYTGQWIGGMFNRLLFVINGKSPVDNYQNFMAPLLALGVVLVGSIGVLLSCIYGWRLLRKDHVLALLLFISLVYVVSVWGRNYHDWLQLKQGVAINGRYLIPVLPFFFLLIGGSYQLAFAGRVAAKGILFVVSFLLFTQGGGISSFIFYSRDSWYWVGDKRARSMNQTAKKIVKPFFVTNYAKFLDNIYQKIPER